MQAPAMSSTYHSHTNPAEPVGVDHYNHRVPQRSRLRLVVVALVVMACMVAASYALAGEMP